MRNSAQFGQLLAKANQKLRRYPTDMNHPDTAFRLCVNAVALTMLAALLSGCGVIHDARMFAPSWCGMDRVTATLYVERSMSAASRAELQS